MGAIAHVVLRGRVFRALLADAATCEQEYAFAIPCAALFAAGEGFRARRRLNNALCRAELPDWEAAEA